MNHGDMGQAAGRLSLGMQDRVYIVLVNWNGWRYTLACLESLFRQAYASWRVIVCDNGSTDGSTDYMKAWANGRLQLDMEDGFPLANLISPAVAKPIGYLEYDRVEAEAGGSGDEHEEPLILIHTGANLGWAGGNNVALRYLEGRVDYDSIWILNNDTIVHPDALSILMGKLRRHTSYGMCGATLVYQHNPSWIQTRGGNRYRPWLAQTRPIGFLESPRAEVVEADIEKRMAYVSGACMLVTRRFVSDVGRLSEIYFLYYEELDWALRARAYGYQLAYASQAVIYHKEGASIGGGNRDRAEKSWTADYFEIRNRVVLTRKFYPWALPVVCLALSMTLANRVRRRQWRRLGMVVKSVFDAFRVRLDTPSASKAPLNIRETQG